MANVTDLTGNKEAITKLAMQAFQQGLIDGGYLSKPQSGEAIMVTFASDYSWRLFHKKKIRQIYGAAFDIAAAEAALPRVLAAREKRIRG